MQLEQNNYVKGNQSLWEHFQYLWRRRSLIFTWTKFNLQAKYIETRLGIIWIFLQPLITAGIYSLAFGRLLGVRVPREGVPFVCFYLSGIVTWQLFNGNISQSAFIIVGNIGLMTQIRFPREAALLVRYCENFVDFIASFIVLEIILLAYGYTPTAKFLFLPLIVLILSLYTVGIMFFVSSIGVFVRDMPDIVNPILRLLFFVSGVIFSIDHIDGLLRTILRLNPVLLLLESFRNIVLHDEMPNIGMLGALFVIGMIVFILGYAYFKKKDATFVDHL